MEPIRLQKVLAQAGVASRRAAEALIVEGRVAVDGKVQRQLGVRVDPARQRVTVDGRAVGAQERVYLLLHKPRGVVCTLRDPEGRRTVLDLLQGLPQRVVSIGRLDYDTSGVLLLTNDGDLAALLSHPRGGTTKVYTAKVKGVVDHAALERWQQAIEIDGKWTRPAQVRLLRREGDKSWLEIVLREGKNRQIHRLGEHAGFPVLRLVRTAFAGLGVEGLRPGQWRHLSPGEVAALKRRRPEAASKTTGERRRARK